MTSHSPEVHRCAHVDHVLMSQLPAGCSGRTLLPLLQCRRLHCNKQSPTHQCCCCTPPDGQSTHCHFAHQLVECHHSEAGLQWGLKHNRLASTPVQSEPCTWPAGSASCTVHWPHHLPRSVQVYLWSGGRHGTEVKGLNSTSPASSELDSTSYHKLKKGVVSQTSHAQHIRPLQ